MPSKLHLEFRFTKFGATVTKLIFNYMLLLYKVKSEFGATVTKLISNYSLLLYKVKSKFGARVHPHMISHFVVGRFIKIGYC